MNQIDTEIRKQLERFKGEVEASGEELRGESMPAITQELFELYEKTGNRLKFERVYFPRRKFLVTFGLLSVWYGRKEDLEKLAEVIREICKESCWALPAHVNRKEKGWERTVDLFACETGQTLAELSRLLGEKLPLDVRTMIRELVCFRLLDSYLEREEGTWRWEPFANNWVAVCAGSLGAMAIYLLGDQPEKQKQCIDRVVRTMDGYLDGMKEDGTCPEGLSYFTYGMSYFTGFAELLLAHTGGKIDLLAQPKVEAVAKFQQLCYFSGGKTVSFSDGSQDDRFRMGLTCYLAGRYDGVEIPDIAAAMGYHTDTCYRWMALYREVIWTEAYLKKNRSRLLPGERSSEYDFTVLSDAQWVIGKGKNRTGMAVKGGHNGEPHNHNDIGSLIYVWNGHEILADLGCGEYCRDYFNENRYTILCNRSLGHNVPIVNGKEQMEGRQYGADSFSAEESSGCVEMSFGAAYGDESMDEVLRRVTWTEEGTMTVQDTFVKARETDWVKENLVTQLEPVVDGTDIRFFVEGAVVCVSVLSGCGEIEVLKECFMNHFGVPEDVWLIQWLVPSETKRFTSSFQIGCLSGRMQVDSAEK